MNRKFLLAPTVAGLLIVATLLGAGCITEKANNSTPSDPVRVGYLNGDLHHLALFVAKNATVGGGKSLFEKNNVKVVDAAGAPFANGGAVMTAFASGAVDIGYLGAPPAITGNVNSLIKTKVIAQANTIGSSLVVRTGINTAQDLSGKKVATPSASSIQNFLLLDYMETNHIDAVNVTIVNLGVALMKASLESGQIDGFIAWQPFPADSVASGVGHVLATSNDIWPHHVCCVVATMDGFAKKNESRVVGFLKAHVAATKWIHEAMADNTSAKYRLLVDIAVNFTSRPRNVVEAALKEIDYGYTMDATFKTAFKEYTDKLITQGIIKQADLAKAGYSSAQDLTDKYVVTTYLDKATK